MKHATELAAMAQAAITSKRAEAKARAEQFMEKIISEMEVMASHGQFQMNIVVGELNTAETQAVKDLLAENGYKAEQFTKNFMSISW